MKHTSNSRPLGVLAFAAMFGLLGILALTGACNREKPRPTKANPDDTPPERERPKPKRRPVVETPPVDPALTGEAAHVIPFADRTSMGYLLLLPPGTDKPEPPTREQLKNLVEQAFPDRQRDGEIDLLLTLIETKPHATDIALPGELEPPDPPDSNVGSAASDPAPEPVDQAALEQLAAKRARQRAFDLIGLHIEILRIGIGDDAVIPSSALQDPVLTRGLSEADRKSLLGRSYALLLRADYRNQNAVRGLRLHQTLVRVAAEHYDAVIHDPDTLETMSVETFSERRLRAAAGNIADQIAIVPFRDPKDDNRLRLSTRGMRRFGAVDLELDGLPLDAEVLQQASDLIAGLALALVKQGEVHTTGFAVQVPDVVEVRGELIRESYSARGYEPSLCTNCPGVVAVHLVERPRENHDPRDHVVARIVAPREQSDAPDYNHSQWIQAAFARLFVVGKGASSAD